ncbi:MAG TPA: hypothetical protein VFF73_15880 [Planctomycetota bacterium]|nr:hypothetical protein [Planctomycetota bacterium]
MSLFKSKEERRLERELEIKRNIQKMRKQVRSLEKDEKGWLLKAKRAKQLGDSTQLNFLKANLKRTAANRRLMERQILNIETFNQLKDQAEAQADFARSLQTVAQSIGEAYGSVNIVEIQKNCEKAIGQYESMQQMMEMFMESSTESMTNLEGATSDDVVSDEEIEKLIDEQIVSEEGKAVEGSLEEKTKDILSRLEKEKED